MKIVMIGQKGLPARSGGIERHVSLLATGLASRGHRVIVYGRRWYVGDAKIDQSIEQRFTGGIHTKHLDAITHSLTALWDARRLRPDIVHIHGTGAALIAPLARLLIPRAKVVVTFHCIDRVLSKWNRLAKYAFVLGEWLACHSAHRLITVSQELARYCQTHFNSQGVYITHPFQFEEVPPASHILSLGLQQEQYLLSVGRLIPDKMLHVLVDAYARARAERPELFERLPLALVGGGAWTDAYVRWLTAKVATVPGVKMLGARSGIEHRALQAHAYAHVFPTASEGLAMAMVEAAAFGRPVVATDLAQNREAVGNQGVFVPVNDVEALSKALIQMAEMTELERWSMGDMARRHVATAFAYEDRIDDVDRVYQELLTGSPALVTLLPQLA